MSMYIIGNGLISRTLEVTAGGVRTISLRNGITGTEYVKNPLQEFSFWVDGVRVTSFSDSQVSEQDGNVKEQKSGFIFTEAVQDEHSLEIHLRRDALTLGLCYRVFPGVPGIEKHLWFRNDGVGEIKLEMMIFEDICVAPGEFCDCEFFRGHQDVPAPPCFCNDGNEDIIRCHNMAMDEGWMMGTTAPGILRYFMVYPHWGNAMNGYSCGGAPFAKFLKSGETFVTDSSLFSVYAGDRHQAEGFRDLVRAVLPEPVSPEGVMYCSWLPFLKNINESLITGLMDQAADMGFDTFVLDDGWFAPPGDHLVDRVKFPNGLEPVAKHCADRGLKFGLWLNIGTNYGQDNVNEAWVAKRADGADNHLGFAREDSNKVMCFATEHRDYVLAMLDELCSRYNVSYFKLDFSSVFSPYGILPWGCHSTEHAYHHGWNDSFIEMYRGMKTMREELKKRHPNLIVDFSFESFGTDVPNIAALQFSEIHHVSNTSADKTQFQRIDRVRRSFYRWLTKLPPERILNGLLSIQGERGPEYFLTSLAGAPLVAGDLIHLEPSVRQRVRILCDAFRKTAAKGTMTEFRVVTDSEEADGFMRYAKDGHGVLCLFNRSASAMALDIPAGFAVENAEDGSHELTVAPQSCAMYLLSKA